MRVLYANIYTGIQYVDTKFEFHVCTYTYNRHTDCKFYLLFLLIANYNYTDNE